MTNDKKQPTDLDTAPIAADPEALPTEEEAAAANRPGGQTHDTAERS